jgi:mRNA-degrading endonuclease YafQ of YafQ-DinJ toxin-antitoxin module
MRFEFKTSFDRSIKSLRGNEKEELKKVAIETIDILSSDRLTHKGLGLKRLRGDYWEVRKGLEARILFRWKGDLVEFVLAGNHNDIRRYLSNI